MVACMKNEQDGDRQELITPQEKAEIEADRAEAEKLLRERKDIRAGEKGVPFTPKLSKPTNPAPQPSAQ